MIERLSSDRLGATRTGRGSRRPSLEALVLASIGFGVLLVLARFVYSGEMFFGFLVWNLFLAAVPLGLSRLLRWREARLGTPAVLALAGLWLLFFPNAPYILTDLFHLEARHRVPLWYDLAVFLSFAWNGLILGFISLRDVQVVLRRRFGRLVGWLSVLGALFLGSFGIYLGRYLRWNSWDLLAHPRSLGRDLAARVLNPLEHPGAWGMTLVFTGFLLLAYLIIGSFAQDDEPTR